MGRNQSESLSPEPAHFTMAISIISYVKDDDDLTLLDETLTSWEKSPEISEILIVDWTRRLNNKNKMVVVRPALPHLFSASYSLNLAFAFVNEPVVCRMDAGFLLLRDDFFTVLKYGLKHDTFIMGVNFPMSVEMPPASIALTHLLYITSHVFKEMNGYNQELKEEGSESLDLRERLVALGAEAMELDLLFMYDKYITCLRSLPHEFDRASRMWNKHEDISAWQSL